MKISQSDAAWLDKHTTEEIRYLRTPKNLAQEITCRIFRKTFGNETLFFAIVGKKIRVIMTDSTVDVIREEFSNWRDAINFVKGMLVVRTEVFPRSVWALMKQYGKESNIQAK
jgi:hypothetical protein